MSSGAQVARLTISFREPVSRSVAVEIVRLAHAAGITSATIHRGSAPPVHEVLIPSPRSLSLADAEGTTIAVIASEGELETFAATLSGLSIGAEFFVKADGKSRELHQHDGGVLAR